jgi:hypothetical protein
LENNQGQKRQLWVPYTLVDQTLQRLSEAIDTNEDPLNTKRYQELQHDVEEHMHSYFAMIQQTQKNLRNQEPLTKMEL